MKTETTQGGIIIPKRKGVQCSFCSRTIYKEQEVKGRLWLVDGKPMCPTCRVTKLNGKTAKAIKDDKRKYEVDKKKAEQADKEKEKKRIEELSANSVDTLNVANEELRKRKGLDNNN